MPRGQLARVPASHGWLFDVLTADKSTVTWAAAGQLPAGFDVAQQFAVLPGGGGRSFMVSCGGSRAMSSALTSYNALRPPRRRVARRLLGLGFRAGLAQRWLKPAIEVGSAAGAGARQRADASLTEHVRTVFEADKVVIAFGAGGGPYRKPVLQVFSADGSPLGYVKVGWNGWTREAVRREAAALRLCARRRTRLGVPALLGHSAWHGLELLFTAPLPAGVRRLPAGSRLPDLDALREIAALGQPPHTAELATSEWWLGRRAQISASIADPAARTRLTLLADRIEQAYGHAAVDFAGWHGDLVPWNLARLGNRLYAWDWECSTGDVPLGFDALHFHFQVAFVARGRPLKDAAAAAERKARPALDSLGVVPANHHLVAVLHLLELFVRHEEARSGSGGTDGRFYPAVAGVLEESLAHAPRASHPHPVSDRS